ncbi:hypothetical protein KNP414_02873 [Paenibacillus mucilaginosus KNP414]|uniref:Uncharacterized protein n=1 Tax=Paenibacillus mucilaginosus (strain KNP414) TaxID=1036673 RepID=F8FD15_PAEMK|nr:hypothetical protein KNP414_02873 [Paenibacillus mucilaginosus KNP414]
MFALAEIGFFAFLTRLPGKVHRSLIVSQKLPKPPSLRRKKIGAMADVIGGIPARTNEPKQKEMTSACHPLGIVLFC